MDAEAHYNLVMPFLFSKMVLHSDITLENLPPFDCFDLYNKWMNSSNVTHFHISLTVCDGSVYDASCCSTKNQCGIDQGDCDSDDECADGFICGLNNCPDSFSRYASADCCTDKPHSMFNKIHHQLISFN